MENLIDFGALEGFETLLCLEANPSIISRARSDQLQQACSYTMIGPQCLLVTVRVDALASKRFLAWVRACKRYVSGRMPVLRSD